MVSITSEYSIYLYSEKVDMRKDISGLIGVVTDKMKGNPYKPKSIFLFYGRNPRIMKVLIREFNRFELTKIRLDDGRFLRPVTSEDLKYGKISWSDFVLLTETVSRPWKTVKYIDCEAV